MNETSCMATPQEIKTLFPDLFEDRLRECDSVAAQALENLGKSYKITRELTSSTVDCSTIVSQAHWIGAVVQTPFIAETQRKSTNSIAVSADDLLPGDAIYAYASLAEAPDKVHNHVALYLGEAADGEYWTIEARGGIGVRLTRLEDVMMAGGLRRFCPNPGVYFAAGIWQDLARRVPKLGRLGARLTSRYGSSERHSGVDIYVGRDKQIMAPHAGEIVGMVPTSSQGVFVHLWSEALGYFSTLGPLRLESAAGISSTFSDGEVLGSVDALSGRIACNVVPGHSVRDLLHWELWAAKEAGSPSPAPQMVPSEVLRNVAGAQQFAPYNALYAVKAGLVGACISQSALEDIAVL